MVLLFCMIRLDYLGFVKDYNTCACKNEKLHNVYGYVCTSKQYRKERYKKGLKQNNRVMDTNH